MVRSIGSPNPQTINQAPQTPPREAQTKPDDAAKNALADQIRCPGMSMLVREGLPVDKDGYVSYGDVLSKMESKLGYDESFGKFLLNVFGNTSGTEGLSSIKDHMKNQRLNLWDLASPKSGGQHVRSLPFRLEDGSVNKAQMKEALDRFAPDGKVTLEVVGKMINAYGQKGIVAGQESGGGIKGHLGALGEQQTAGEVMLMFSAFAKRDASGQVYMDRASFEQAYAGHIPADFVKSRDSLGLGTVGQWTGLTVKAGAQVTKDDAKTTFSSLTDGIQNLFRREDAVIEGADRALGKGGRMSADSAMLEGISKSGICPVMPGAAQNVSAQPVRNPQETADLHNKLGS